MSAADLIRAVNDEPVPVGYYQVVPPWHLERVRVATDAGELPPERVSLRHGRDGWVAVCVPSSALCGPLVVSVRVSEA